MAKEKKDCTKGMAWLTMVVGLLYLLGAWWPAAFGWWAAYVPPEGVFFLLMGLFVLKKK